MTAGNAPGNVGGNQDKAVAGARRHETGSTRMQSDSGSRSDRIARRELLGGGLALGASAAVAAPAVAQGASVSWTMQTSWPTAIHLHHMAEYWARKLGEMSGGRFTVDVQPSGSMVGAFEVLDAASSGVLQVAHSWSGYWIGRNTAAAFFASVPFHFTPVSHLAWIYEGGGLELWQRMYDELGLQVKVLPCGITHAEIVAWSHRPLVKLEDWQGLKYRAPGYWGEILREQGVAVVTLPAAELYQAMERRVLDATEFNTPYTDFLLRFHEVAEYFTGPGMHQPTVLFELLINRAEWDALPEEFRVMAEEAARATTLWALLVDLHKSMGYIDRFRDEFKREEVQVAPETQWEIYRTAMNFLKRKAEENPFFAEVFASASAYHRRYAAYDEFMTPVPVREAHRVPEAYRVE